MSSFQQTLKLKDQILNSSIYRGGNSIESISQQHNIPFEDIVKLASNENPFPTSPQVTAALAEAINGLNFYPVGNDANLCKDLATYIGHGLTADQFFTGNGGCDVLRMLADGLLTPDNEAIICPPTFPIYELTINRTGAKVVHVPLKTPDFALDVPAILEAVNDKTRLLYLCSPNNPTGSHLNDDELRTLMEGLPKHVLVIFDEVYWQFKDDPAAGRMFDYLKAGKPIAIVHSFSKVFGLAGLRLGYGIAPPEIAQYILRMRLPFHTNSLTMIGAHAALKDHNHLEEVISLTISERSRMYGRLSSMSNVEVWPTQANFLLLKPKRNGKDLELALQKRGVIVRELSGFYMPGFLRVSIGLPEANNKFLASLSELLTD